MRLAVKETMKTSKRRKLTRAGFKVGTVQEFLDLSDEEMALIDLKIRLIKKLKSVRADKRIRQQDLARMIASSQSRIAKMEAGSPNVSLDLICRALFAMGVSAQTLARSIAAKKAA
jgi:DNA-binding XRE family transcriptional regulator